MVNKMAEKLAIKQLRRRRNLALLWVLLFFILMIFAISVVQFGRSGQLQLG